MSDSQGHCERSNRTLRYRQRRGGSRSAWLPCPFDPVGLARKWQPLEGQERHEPRDRDRTSFPCDTTFMTQRKSKWPVQARDLLGCGAWATFVLFVTALSVGLPLLEWGLPPSFVYLAAFAILVSALVLVWSKVTR